MRASHCSEEKGSGWSAPKNGVRVTSDLLTRFLVPPCCGLTHPHLLTHQEVNLTPFFGANQHREMNLTPSL
jgi:hypothetical protein